MKIYSVFNYFFRRLINLPQDLLFKIEKQNYGFIDKKTVFERPSVCTCPEKIFLYEETNIYSGSKFIISPVGIGGRFIMKRKSGSAQGLTVITGNHSLDIPIDRFMKDNIIARNGDVDKDVVVEEDVWLGANVTLLAGVTVGRGAIVGAGSVVRKSVPPYAVVVGNPAKVISFVFTPEEIIEREKTLYSEEERYDYKKLARNYKRYYESRIKEINNFLK